MLRNSIYNRLCNRMMFNPVLGRLWDSCLHLLPRKQTQSKQNLDSSDYERNIEYKIVVRCVTVCDRTMSVAICAMI